MVEYFREMEQDFNIRKEQVQKGKFLYFVPDGEKFEFCSNDPDLNQWCKSVKNKRVKGNAIKFVVNAARQGLNSNSSQKTDSTKKAPQSSKSGVSGVKKIDPNSLSGWDENVAKTFNLYCQKSGMKYPDFQTIGVEQRNGGQIVSVKMLLKDGSSYVAQAANKQSARDGAIKKYAQEVLGVKFKENEQEEEKQEVLSLEEQRMKAAEILAKYPDDYKKVLNAIHNPKYATEQIASKGGQGIKCTLLLEDGQHAWGYGLNKKDAQQDAAKEYIKSQLKIDVDNFAQYEMISEEDAWSALSFDRYGFSHNKMETMFENGEKLPKVVSDYLSWEKAERERAIAKRKRLEAEEARLEAERARLQAERKLKCKTERDKIKQVKFSLIDKQTDIVAVQKSNTENGRSYDMTASDGTKYHLDIGYGNEIKKKAFYIDNRSFLDEMEPWGYTETEVRALTVSCDKTKDGQTSSFTLKATSPHLEAKNPYRLDLMFLSNLKMTVKNASVGWMQKDVFNESPAGVKTVGNAYLLLKLLDAANDQIVRSPKLVKQMNNTQRIASNGKEM